MAPANGPNAKYDVCVVGHVTRDVIHGAGPEPRIQPGGAAYYGAAVLARLGLKVRLVTKLTPADRELLRGLRELGVAITAKESSVTTVFEIDRSGGPDSGSFTAVSVADAFDPSDFDGIAARALFMDPLTTHEGSAAFMAAAARAAPVIAMDLQGFVRKFLIPGVTKDTLAAAKKGLAAIAIAKADIAEAAALTGETAPLAAARALAGLGIREVIVTSGAKGSLLLAEGRFREIPALPPAAEIDTTGAGDSYLAGYLCARLEGEPADRAAQFGAAVASLKIAGHGAFAGSRDDIAAVLARQPV